MENFKNWMVGLDLTSVDETILAYTQYLAEIFSPEKIHFVHIANPEALSGKEPNKEAIKAEMEVLVGGYFKDHPGTICEVYDGKPLFELWRESYLHNTDLFIVGSKHLENGRGIMPKKFVRKSFCSVLFIPEGTKPRIDKILVPTDFSEYSSVALQSAIEISKKSLWMSQCVFLLLSVDVSMCLCVTLTVSLFVCLRLCLSLNVCVSVSFVSASVFCVYF